jgi:energy-coupling factor transporter ATP-binding protein EcfA2
MTKIIFLNGPSGSGKSTIAKLIQQLEPRYVYNEAMSWPAKEGLKRMFQLRPDYAAKLQKKPDTVQPLFGGHTWRGMQIGLIEDYLKPMYGDDILGEMMAQRIMEKLTAGTMYRTYTVDVGQPQECMPLIERFGAQNCRLVHVIRPDVVFEDTREYIVLDDVHIESFHNRFGEDLLPTQVEQMFKDWI